MSATTNFRITVALSVMLLALLIWISVTEQKVWERFLTSGIPVELNMKYRKAAYSEQDDSEFAADLRRLFRIVGSDDRTLINPTLFDVNERINVPKTKTAIDFKSFMPFELQQEDVLASAKEAAVADVSVQLAFAKVMNHIRSVIATVGLQVVDEEIIESSENTSENKNESVENTNKIQLKIGLVLYKEGRYRGKHVVFRSTFSRIKKKEEKEEKETIDVRSIDVFGSVAEDLIGIYPVEANDATQSSAFSPLYRSISGSSPSSASFASVASVASVAAFASPPPSPM